mgnify:CR=1 FL=1
MRSYTQLLSVNLRLFLREPITAFFTLGFPVMLVLIFGAIYGNEPTPLFGGRGSMDISMPGYAALILGAVGFMTVTINTSSYREARILRRFRATPLRPLSYIAADVTANLVMTLLGMVGVVLVGWLLFRVHFAGQPLSVLAAVILSALAMFSVGYVIASLAPNARAAQVISMVIFYPMMFLSGAGMPVEILPASLRRVSDFLPLTYAARLLRGLWFGESWGDHAGEVAVLAAILLICTILAARLFRWE